jgi:hypothetical protein
MTTYASANGYAGESVADYDWFDYREEPTPAYPAD